MLHEVAIVAYERELLGWVMDLPGCVAAGRDRADLDLRLRLAIAEHLTWLRSHGEDAGDGTSGDETSGDDTSWTAAQEVDAQARRPTGGDFLFELERGPLSSAGLEGMIARMRYAQADLLASARGLPGLLLDWEPPASAIGEPDPWSPEPRTIRQIAVHALQLDLFYRESLRDGPAPGIFERVRPPEEEFEATIALLRGLDDEGRFRVWRPVHPGSADAEEWTARKVVRRRISHLRAHTAEIAQRRTWVLLGAPLIERAHG